MNIFHDYIITKLKYLSNIISEYNKENITKAEFLNLLEKNCARKFTKVFHFLEEERRYTSIYGFKVDRKLNIYTYKIGKILKEIENIPKIKDKNIFNDPSFLNSFYTIIEKILYLFGFTTQNIGDFVKYFKNIIDSITYKDFVLIDCGNNPNEKYNCGRAIMRIEIPPSKFLIFNTNDDGYIDEYVVNVYNKYSNLFRDEKVPTDIEPEYKEIDIGNLSILEKKFNWKVRRFKTNDLEKVVITKDGIKYKFVFTYHKDSVSSYSINGKTFTTGEETFFPKEFINMSIIAPGFFVKFFNQINEYDFGKGVNIEHLEKVKKSYF